jgi:hypothetical protein
VEHHGRKFVADVVSFAVGFACLESSLPARGANRVPTFACFKKKIAAAIRFHCLLRLGCIGRLLRPP